MLTSVDGPWALSAQTFVVGFRRSASAPVSELLLGDSMFVDLLTTEEGPKAGSNLFGLTTPFRD